MHQQIQNRIDTLRKEMEVGQQRMHDLEQQVSQLRDTMLRISGAIQVLEELQAEAAPAATTPDNGNGGHGPAAAEAGSGSLLLGD
jgi:predicted  nucleic acid-binding Zn-ribbon protein